MKITICIGSSCHLKGSRQVIEQLQALITKNNLTDKVELTGTFCLSHCQEGVCSQVDDQFFSLTPEKTDSFFHSEILPRV